MSILCDLYLDFHLFISCLYLVSLCAALFSPFLFRARAFPPRQCGVPPLLWDIWAFFFPAAVQSWNCPISDPMPPYLFTRSLPPHRALSACLSVSMIPFLSICPSGFSFVADCATRSHTFRSFPWSSLPPPLSVPLRPLAREASRFQYIFRFSRLSSSPIFPLFFF